MMAHKTYFANPYKDYSPEAATKDEFQMPQSFSLNLQNFKSSNLNILLTEMKSEIFYDGTIYTGSAGLAMYYFRCALKENSIKLYKKALKYIDLDKLKGRRISFLCGDAGPLALATVISYKLGTGRPETLPDHDTLARRLMSLIRLLKDSPDELLYGKSGYLYALLFVNKYISGMEVIPGTHIEKVIESILISGKQYATEMKNETPLLYQWHDKIYLGAAHGMAGILYMLLKARSYIYVHTMEIRSFIKPAVDWLLKQQFPSGNFPSSLGSASGDRLVQWCHGAPGFVPLCLEAYQTFGDYKYMRVALQCGDVIWNRGLCAKGYSLCHGVSGNAYAFLQLYHATKESIHLYRACRFLEYCVEQRPGTENHSPDRPASLFEGLVGRLYLAEDIAQPLDALFPAMCL